MYVRVTQHNGNLHPHSAASNVVERQCAKMELQPVLQLLETAASMYSVSGKRSRSNRPAIGAGGLLSVLEPCQYGSSSHVGTNAGSQIAMLSLGNGFRELFVPTTCFRTRFTRLLHDLLRSLWMHDERAISSISAVDHVVRLGPFAAALHYP
jgi:hypothetical protein